MTVLEKYFLITSINPRDKSREFIHHDEFGDSWFSGFQMAKKFPSLEKAVPDDGMGKPGDLAKGRDLEIWSIEVTIEEFIKPDQTAQRLKEAKLAELEAQKQSIEEQMRKLEQS